MTPEDRIQTERDLYRQLLDIASTDAIEPTVQKALALAVELSDAERVYLRLHDPASDRPHPASLAHACSASEVTDIETRISQGIIAEAIACGRTIHTPSAFLDARFKDRVSVRNNEIEAVLCTPLGGTPPAGVLYLAGRRGGGPFSDDTLELVETLGRYLGPFVHRLLERQANRDAQDPTAPFRERIACEDLVGRSEALAALLKTVAMVAPLPSLNLLITGPSGTGKTAVARVIAANSPRSTGPFVEINCAAMQDTLLEAELFGSKKGAHSAAVEDRPGKIAAAEGGTLLLDEVAELSAEAQAKLLQFLQNKTYYPLGDNTLRTADVRVIAATHQDLPARVADGSFREDLYYRLHVVPVRVPALAERTSDIPLLLERLVERLADGLQVPRLHLSAAAAIAATHAAWPGNIRQLENAARAGLVRAVAEGAAQIEPGHLFEGPTDPGSPSYQSATRAFQSDLVRNTLDRHGWNVTRAAEDLSITRSHLYNLIRDFDLRRPAP